MAMRDLEIRGAGNLLGREQSGHIAAVGYDMYCRLLSETVGRLRRRREREPAEVEIDIETSAFLPESYVGSSRNRIRFYRRISSACNPDELDEAKKEIVDRYGPAPPEAENFFKKNTLRIRARELGITYIGVREKWLAIRFENLKKLAPLSERMGDRGRIVGDDFVYIDLPEGPVESMLDLALEEIAT